MTRRTALATVFLAAMLAAAPSLAHEEFRVIGTVQKISANQLDVKQTKDGKTISMELVTNSSVTRDKKKVGIADVKVGLNVVVDGLGDSLEELTVVEIRIVPAPPK